ncbi:hypothetical protein LAC81_35690 (plasmid) [Ensifer adhaerens]|uniref:hypothetical protein n=1 Tax=Ensifer adhaerens TaxID=106592 RepID=UPI001CBBF0D4|nr:hypothetical protein [Ensifer adhaerens]MBZ7927285.1 hypothetical protein [Ensifer adhaerens]UAX98300.1 hypothetical protein LAC78_36990 [Ensifer adhaerens]UAY05683.1 hypothetical protein LAC80_35695 [Ensifer adhaerens]UAY13061.1 hypothetical protein LAC81_35690 [Ensifer adhaerens]
MAGQSGYVLPDDFIVICTALENVVNARNIDRRSEEGECLARHALDLFMSGTRRSWELELRLTETCRALEYSPLPSGKTEVQDFLPELAAWARSLTASPRAATALSEQTLEYAIGHVDDFRKSSDVRGWLIGLMLELRFGRSSGRYKV